MASVNAKTIDWSTFKEIFGGKNNEYSLPRRWGGGDYYDDLNKLLTSYRNKLIDSPITTNPISDELKESLPKVIDILLKAVRKYLHGYPADAFGEIKTLMAELEKQPLYVDPTKIGNLYRMVPVDENKTYDRTRVFHIPYDKVSIVKTNRYSLPGYPCLYLSSSLELAESESNVFAERKRAIASRFVLKEDVSKIKILDLSFMPQELADDKWADPKKSSSPRTFIIEEIDEAKEMQIEEAFRKGRDKRRLIIPPPGLDAPERYMLWYPLIAACSYIRTNRNNLAFAQEYMIPQLVTQWLRGVNNGMLVGIKYFSCYSMRTSTLGANYVFPTSGDPILLPPNRIDGFTPEVKQYCPILNDVFKLTTPLYALDYADAEKLAEALDGMASDEFGPVYKVSWTSKKQKISVPENVMYIPPRAFRNAYSLETVKIPKSVVGIGAGAFDGCEMIKKLKIPEDAEYIGSETFSGCSNLEHIEVEERNSSFASVDGVLFKKNKEHLIRCPEGVADTYLVPDGVKEICDGAFKNCTKLRKIILPNSLEKIGEAAFAGCDGLTSIIIPSGVAGMGKSAFVSCENLKKVCLPNSLKSIGGRAFRLCKCLTDIEFAGTHDEWNKFDKHAEWDDETPEYVVHFVDGTRKSKSELKGLEPKIDTNI